MNAPGSNRGEGTRPATLEWLRRFEYSRGRGEEVLCFPEFGTARVGYHRVLKLARMEAEGHLP